MKHNEEVQCLARLKLCCFHLSPPLDEFIKNFFCFVATQKILRRDLKKLETFSIVNSTLLFSLSPIAD